MVLEVTNDKPVAVKGLDNSDDLLFQKTMLQARDTGMITSFTAFPIIEHGGELVTHYYYPLYDSTEPPATVEERRAKHIGFISAVAYVPAEYLASFLPESYQGIDAIFYSQLDDDASSEANSQFENAKADKQVVLKSYQFEEVQMNIAARASAKLRNDMISSTSWWVFCLGLLITIWMSSFVIWSSRQSRKIIKLVEERTYDLADRTTKLSEVNAALRESETRYRMLANNISDVIFTHDMQGICTYISPSIKKQNGFSVEECLHKPIYIHMVEKYAQLTKQSIEKAAAQYEQTRSVKHSESPFEFETICKDGSTKTLESIFSSVYNDSGQIVGFMGVMRDITARKQAEGEKSLLQTAYLQAQKMEATGTLAGGIAHDFNNLLTGVIGHADLLKLEFGHQASALHSLDVIEMAAMRAKDLASQLLGFARKGQFQSVPVDINQMLREVISLIDRTLDKNIAISLLHNNFHPIVMGDPAQITNIFLNLAVNARDAMPNGGKLIFEINLEELDSAFCRTHIDTGPGDYCVISVTDTGLGIPEDKIEHIFEPFFTDKLDGKGTGLGLAMVYGVTKNHNGTVTVYSEVGKGSVFRIYLPASDNPGLQIKKLPVQELKHGAGNILLVDDQLVVREIAQKMLHHLGYNVLLAEDGIQGFNLYRENVASIDLVIIDMIMPHMGGLECLEAMRKINPEVKAILASGFSKESIADKINEEHIMGFLQKPFRLHELSELVAAIHH